MTDALGDGVQAQRDYFGSHGFERLDRDGTYHADWALSLSTNAVNP